MTSHQYRDEPDVPFTVFRDDVKKGICQSLDHCSIAVAGTDAVGVPVAVNYDMKDGCVRAAWTQDGRVHQAVVEPNQEAVRIVMGTDTQKSALARTIPADGSPLVFTKIRSRESQTETPEEAQQRRDRAKELAELRAAGLEPPAKKRAYRPVVAQRTRARGVAMKAAGEK